MNRAQMTTVFSIAIGGAIGALLRHGVNIGSTAIFGAAFPVGTITVNIVGSFVMGVIAGILTTFWTPPEAIRALLTIGLLGSFTTFSTFSLDAISLFERGDTVQSVLYILASVCGAILALILGLTITRGIAS